MATIPIFDELGLPSGRQPDALIFRPACKFCSLCPVREKATELLAGRASLAHPHGATSAIRPYPWMHVHGGGNIDLLAEVAWTDMQNMFPLSILPVEPEELKIARTCLGQVIHPILWKQQVAPSMMWPQIACPSASASMSTIIERMLNLCEPFWDPCRGTLESVDLQFVVVRHYKQLLTDMFAMQYLLDRQYPEWTVELRDLILANEVVMSLAAFVHCCKHTPPSAAEFRTVSHFVNCLIILPARRMEVAPWDLITTLLEVSMSHSFGAKLGAGDTLDVAFSRTKEALDVLEARSLVGDVSARRELQIKLSLDYNERIFATNFSREQRIRAWKHINQLALDHGFVLDVAVRLFHVNSLDWSGLWHGWTRLRRFIFGPRTPLVAADEYEEDQRTC